MKRTTTRSSYHTLGAAVAALTTLASIPAQATLLAYEGFDYPTQFDPTPAAAAFGILPKPANLGNPGDANDILFYGTTTAINGGTGWASAWGGYPASKGDGATEQYSGPIQATSLTYGSLDTIGGSVLFDGSIGASSKYWRVLETPIIHDSESDLGLTGSTYISFLGQRIGEETDTTSDFWAQTWPDGSVDADGNSIAGDYKFPNGVYPYGDNLYPRGAALRLYGSPDEDNYVVGEKVQFGAFSNRDTNTWGMTGGVVSAIDGTGEYESNVQFGGGEVTLVVIRIDHVDPTEFGYDGSLGDHIYVWINPDFSAGEDPNTADLASFWEYDLSDIASIGPWAGNADAPDTDGNLGRAGAEMLYDEIRIGTTLADVIPGLTLGDTVVDPIVPDPVFAPITVVPEPSAFAALLLLATFGFSIVRRRR